MILMGLVKLPSIYDYWQKGKVFHSAVASRISRKRFFELHWYLHFVDNDMLPQPGQDNYDKLGKVRLIMNILTSNFSATYEFGRDVSIDQAMIPLDAKAIYAKKKNGETGNKNMDGCRCKQWLWQQSWCIHRQERRQHWKRTWGICSKVTNCCSTSLVLSYLLWQFLL